MRSCKKCGKQLSDNDIFCNQCGTKNEIKNNFKVLKFVIISIVIISILFGGGFFWYKKTTAIKAIENGKKLSVVSVNIKDYPKVEITMEASNFDSELNLENLSLKEDDVYQKDLKLIKLEEQNKYNILYIASDKTSKGEKTVRIAYADKNNEKLAEVKYTADNNIKKEEPSNSSSDNVVKTNDNNEMAVKNALDKYEDSFQEMVNYKDTSYIRSAIDLSGDLLNEFTKLVNNYKEQKISEYLLEYKIEGVEKLNDNQYEVTVYERYNIYYGKERSEKYIEYRNVYIVNNTNSGFKVNAIKKVDTISSREI